MRKGMRKMRIGDENGEGMDTEDEEDGMEGQRVSRGEGVTSGRWVDELPVRVAE